MTDRLTASLPWILLIVAAAIVSGGDAFLLSVGTVTVLMAMLAVALNVIMGYSGLINLGIGAFYALGAYGAAKMTIADTLPPILILILMPLVAFGVGMVIGIPMLRTRGLHFAVATLGLGLIISDVINNWTAVTNGPIGLSGIERPGSLDLLAFSIAPGTPKGFFQLAAIMLVLMLAGSWLYHRSRMARVLIGTRDDELLTRSLGFSVTTYKLVAFSLSCALSALTGVLYAWFIQYISPTPFSFFAVSFPAFVIVAVGGAGSVWGPVLGAVLLTGLPEFLHVEARDKVILNGAVLLAVITLLPRGLAPTLGDLWRIGGKRLRSLFDARGTGSGSGSGTGSAGPGPGSATPVGAGDR